MLVSGTETDGLRVLDVAEGWLYRLVECCSIFDLECLFINYAF